MTTVGRRSLLWLILLTTNHRFSSLLQLSRDASIVSLVEIGPRTATGYSSGAYRCLGEDGRYYFVKSPRQAGARAVIAEWLAAGLGKAMALPVREVSFVDVPEALAFTEEVRILRPGIAFGSIELAQPDDLTFSQAESLPRELRAEVLAFDYWLRNSDRTLGPAGGNPNMLSSRGHPLTLIDHGNAFDPEFEVRSFLANHAFTPCRALWLEAARRRAWKKRAKAALKRLPAMWEAMPACWHENDGDEMLHDFRLEDVMILLQQVEADEALFWNPLLTP